MHRVHRIDLTPAGLFRALSWRGVLLLAVSAAVGVTLLLLAGFVFLLILPIAVVGGLIARWMVGRPKPPQQRRPQDGIIEGRFEVVDIEQVQETPPHARRRGGTPWG
jgi:hypothetical protein